MYLELFKHFTAVCSPLPTPLCGDNGSNHSHQKFCNKLLMLNLFYYRIRKVSLSHYIPVHVPRQRDYDILRLAKLMPVSF